MINSNGKVRHSAEEIAAMGATCAVSLAMYLGMIAQTDEEAKRAADLAGEIASANSMTLKDLEPCRAAAIRLHDQIPNWKEADIILNETRKKLEESK